MVSPGLQGRVECRFADVEVFDVRQTLLNEHDGAVREWCIEDGLASADPVFFVPEFGRVSGEFQLARSLTHEGEPCPIKRDSLVRELFDQPQLGPLERKPLSRPFARFP
jgi:hypothetical protein